MSSQNKTEKKRVVLAYSGGLDASCILVWLIEKGYEVIAYFAKIGQLEQVEEVRDKAFKLGAADFVCMDLRKEFVEEFVFPNAQANAIYEDRYFMGTSLSRPCIARGLIRVAHQKNAEYVAHGADGIGNDQLRYELTSFALSPKIQVIAPWKIPEFYERFKNRQGLIEYSKQQNIPLLPTAKHSWMTDKNIFHTGYEAGILDKHEIAAPDSIYTLTSQPEDWPNKPDLLKIEFVKGIPVNVTNQVTKEEHSDPLEIFTYLNNVGKTHGVGRIDIVENKLIGMKSRGIFETPGYTILYHAHLDIEALVLDREVRKIKQSLVPRYSDLVYYGFWFSPEADFLRDIFAKSQENVNGYVIVSVFKGNVYIRSRDSNNDTLVDSKGHEPSDAAGFIKINATRLKENYTQRGEALAVKDTK